jgi:hypothetical protein
MRTDCASNKVTERRTYHALLFTSILAIVLIGATDPACAERSRREEQREIGLDVRLFSIQDGIESVEGHGNGYGGHNATLGLAFKIDEQSANVNVKVRTKKGRFLITVSPTDCGEKTLDGRSFPLELDMTDLRATTLELAKDKDGRKFLLSLTPSVKINPKPNPLRLTANCLNIWRLSFSGSRILLNDEKYLGIFGASGGELAFLQIPGIGRVEFSLKPFRNAEVLGQLESGVILIEYEGQKIEITNVSYGLFASALPGGPYEVWTRVTPSGMTIEEEVQASLHQFEESIKNNSDLELTPQKIEEGREAIRKGYAVSLGVSGIPEKDRIDEHN